MPNPNGSDAALLRFRRAHPTSAVDVAIVGVGARVVVRVRVYRDANDRRPAASALVEVAERDALGGVESRAIGRALAALGFVEDATPPVPNAAPARPTIRAAEDPYAAPPRSVSRRVESDAPRDASRDAQRERLADVDALITSCAAWGVRPRRVAAWRAQLPTAAPSALDEVERRLRRWLARRDPV